MLKYTVRELRVKPGEDPKRVLSRLLGIKLSSIAHFEPLKKSVDARGREPKISLNLRVGLLEKPKKKRGLKLEEGWGEETVFTFLTKRVEKKVVVVGFGPSGIFASLLMALSGISHIVIERGKRIEEREKDVKNLMENGVFNRDSNVLFGEGGAGTFSDGKLTTRVRSPYIELFKKLIVKFGVDEKKLIWSRPHIGTEGVRKLVKNIREFLLEREIEIKFSEKMVDIEVNDGEVVGIKTDKGFYPCDILILATGHSARDVYTLLKRKGVLMEKKIFAIGVRVEHPREYIDRLFYKGKKGLPPAEYQLSVRKGERGIYTFCMCPGGYVINASSEEDGLNINGMSMESRSGSFSNSAVVVNVLPQDIKSEDPLSGMEFQRYWEKKAFSIKGGFLAPCQNLLDFIEKVPPKREIRSTYKPGVFPYPVEEVLPLWVVEHLRFGFLEFDRKFKGFVTDEASLVAPEMRTSSPVRIVRDEKGESVSIKGLFPVGEGSGYAGGIASSAADGMRVVDRIFNVLKISKEPL